jgi:hypothetical protein
LLIFEVVRMGRKNLVLGFAAVLWAQTSTAWKWYGYTQENSSNPNIRPVPTIWSSQKGVVRYLSDTIYVMGTYRGPNMTSMELPNTVGSSINPIIPGGAGVTTSAHTSPPTTDILGLSCGVDVLLPYLR